MRTPSSLLGKIAASLLALILCMSGTIRPSFAGLMYNFTTVDDPAGVEGTVLTGISDGVVVGQYGDENFNSVGFMYDNGVFAQINDPSGGETRNLAISGNAISGTYFNDFWHGFIYKGSMYTTIDDPAANGGATQINGISGDTVVGSYGNSHGFMYDGTTFTTLDDPSATFGNSGATKAYGVSGNTVVGSFVGTTFAHGTNQGFIYSNGVYTTLDDPLAAPSQQGTFPYGIDGNDIVGAYMDANQVFHGFLYNGSTFATLDDPLAGAGMAQGTRIFGISDDGTLVGSYVDSSGETHGFIATPVPEPTSGVFLVLSAYALLRRRRGDSGCVKTA